MTRPKTRTFLPAQGAERQDPTGDGRVGGEMMSRGTARFAGADEMFTELEEACGQ